MNLKAKLVGEEDERAVSPVIGVILMVAITVILAAVIAAFVLDMGDLDDSAPQAQFDWNGGDSNITVDHTNGENIDGSDLTVAITLDDGTNTQTESVSLSSEYTAGDTIDIFFHDDGSDSEVRVRGDVDDRELGESDYNNLDLENDISDTGDITKVSITWKSDGTSTILTEYEN